MADRGDTHYHVPNLNFWFFISSLLLLVTVVWTVIDDWNAEWKTYQREFRQLELEKATAEFAELEAQDHLAREQALLSEVAKAEETLDAQRDKLEEAEDAVREAKEARYIAEEAFKTSKANFNWDKYLGEEDILHDDETGAADVDVALTEVRDETNVLEFEFQKKDAEYVALTKALEALRKPVTDAEKDLATATRELERVRKKIDQLDPSQVSVQVADVIRDFPGLDFVGPNLKITKQVLDDLTFELNFTKKTRIDMCTTCHVAIDRKGFEELAGEPIEEPFRSHPRLDLFLSSTSPHPMKDIGCTICHRGSGESLSFQHVDHRPSSTKQAADWYEKYHFKKQKYWDYPMLKSQHVEASCVQCHTDSMELIADDAPKVTEGYRLFERYACYACHKVEWFPTKRKPGPSLTNLAAKLTPEFVDPWIADPKAFRPTTWMPQIFHLENYAPDEVVVKSRYGNGDDIKGAEWNETSVAALTAYLFANHPKEELDGTPVEGDVEQGREKFYLVGCTACHNMAPYEKDGSPFKGIDGIIGADAGLAFEADRYNTAGPNLRGVATKIDRTWLYNWLKDPAAYWAETNMPNLRLSDQDAADITAFIMDDPDGIFTDVPAGWEEGKSQIDLAALREQARWYYQKDGRTAVETRLGLDPETGEPLADQSGSDWADQGKLAVAVGEAIVRNQGCFSCHLIGGMENDMPIGTELTDWGSKTVDKLDFGMAYRMELPATNPHTGESELLAKLDYHYREGWLARKLERPRSYDLSKIKNPKERLRMPWFDFTDDQVDALVTFVIGLVIDETQDARMVPTPAQAQMDIGLRAIRQKNCMACHQIEPGSITYEHENGSLVTVDAEPFTLPYDTLPPPLTDKASLLDELDAWAEYNEEDPVEELAVRLLSSHPDVGESSSNSTIPVDKITAVTPPLGGDFIRHVTGYYLGGGAMIPDAEAPEDEDPFFPVTAGYDEDAEANLIFDTDGVARPYEEEEYDKVRWTFAPPVLWNEGHKVQRDWFYSFLKDPTTLREQIRVKMPTFSYKDGEAEAIADYFAHKARQDWYARYAKTMRLMLGRELKDDTGEWPLALQYTWPAGALFTKGTGLSLDEVGEESGLGADSIAAIEAGSKPDIMAKFDKLYDWATDKGFRMPGQVGESYEQVERRAPSHLATFSDNLVTGREVGEKGVNCYQCHPTVNPVTDSASGAVTPPGTFPETPIAWAPNLKNARERLREAWVQEWLWSPKFVYPGTAMPDNFAADAPQYQDQFPRSTNQEQIHAVMDWLYNLDRAPTQAD